MATIKGVNKTLVDAGGIGTVGQGELNGRVKVSIDEYSLASQTGATDILELFDELPAGARILAIHLVQTGTQTSTFKLGTSYNDDEFLAAGQTGLQTANAEVWVSGHHYVVGTSTLDNQIIMTFAGAVGAAGTLYAEVYYVTD